MLDGGNEKRRGRALLSIITDNGAIVYVLLCVFCVSIRFFWGENRFPATSGSGAASYRPAPLTRLLQMSQIRGVRCSWCDSQQLIWFN